MSEHKTRTRGAGTSYFHVKLSGRVETYKNYFLVLPVRVNRSPKNIMWPMLWSMLSVRTQPLSHSLRRSDQSSPRMPLSVSLSHCLYRRWKTVCCPAKSGTSEPLFPLSTRLVSLQRCWAAQLHSGWQLALPVLLAQLSGARRPWRPQAALSTKRKAVRGRATL